MIVRAVLLVLSLLCLGGTALAQILPSQDGAQESPATPPTKKRDVGPSAPSTSLSCVDIVVEASATRADGETWDPYRNREAPDYRISEATTGASAQCEDTTVCAIRVNPVAQSLSFTILDDDWPDKDDAIGSGSCKVGGTCTIGLARLRMTPC
jgi:hypothetical protein